MTFDAYIAQTMLEADRVPEALELAASGRRARPDDYRFAQLEAEALAATGEVDRAVALLEDEVAKRPESRDVHLGLAALCVDRGRFDCAESALARAEEQFPTSLRVVFQRGAMNERRGRFPEAEQAFREVLARDPQHGPSLNYLGYLLVERRERLDEAVSLIRRALETDPWNPSYLDSLGWAYFIRGELDQAERPLARAAEQLPLNSVVQDHWGDLLWEQGQRERAIAAWERALKGDLESIEPSVISRKIEDARRTIP